MSELMDEQFERWTGKRKSKSALVLEIILGNTTVAEASRVYDRPPSDVSGTPIIPTCGNRIFLTR